MKFSVFYQEYLKRRERELAPAAYWSHIGAISRVVDKLGIFEIEEITADQLSDLFRSMLGTNPTTWLNYKKRLSPVFEEALKQELIEVNPCRELKFRRNTIFQAKLYSEHEINLILSKSKEKEALYTSILLALYCGLRRGEIVGLKWENYNKKDCAIHIDTAIYAIPGELYKSSPKTSSSIRKIHIPQTLETYLSRLERRTPYIVSGKYLDGCIRPGYITQSFGRLLKELGITGRFHDLRHTHASYLLAKGIDIPTVSRRLGHSNPGITMKVYAHALPGRDVEAAIAIDEYSFRCH